MSVTYCMAELLSYLAEEVDAIGPLDLSLILTLWFILVPEARHRFELLSGLRHRRTGFCGQICTAG